VTQQDFFLAQGFPIKNKDVLYVANASSLELQKFLNIMVSVVGNEKTGRERADILMQLGRSDWDLVQVALSLNCVFLCLNRWICRFGNSSMS
jgi:hypothetical protein